MLALIPSSSREALGDTRAAILVRLRSGRCFSADPSVPSVQPRTGRPRRHGHKFACDAPATWPAPADDLSVADERMSSMAPCACGRGRGCTPRRMASRPARLPSAMPAARCPQRDARSAMPAARCPQRDARSAMPAARCPQRDARGRRPIVRGTLLLVEVSRLPQQPRQPQALWLWWHTPHDGDSIPNLPQPRTRAGRASVRRFAVEQTFRFPEADAQLDPCAGAPPRASRPLDLARAAGLHPAYTRPTPSCAWPAHWPMTSRSPGSVPSVPSVPSRPAHVPRNGSDAGLRRCWCASPSWPPHPGLPHPGLSTTTLRMLAPVPRASQRQALGARHALSGDHQGHPGRHAGRLNQSTRSSSSRQRPLLSLVARLLMLKSQAELDFRHLKQHSRADHTSAARGWTAFSLGRPSRPMWEKEGRPTGGGAPERARRRRWAAL
jgi:hypothetical protein